MKTRIAVSVIAGIVLMICGLSYAAVTGSADVYGYVMAAAGLFMILHPLLSKHRGDKRA